MSKFVSCAVLGAVALAISTSAMAADLYGTVGYAYLDQDLRDTQLGAIHLATSLVADAQLLIAAGVWAWAAHVAGLGFTGGVTASVVSMAAGALFANVVSVSMLIGETLMMRR